jgi:hypothetical protein
MYIADHAHYNGEKIGIEVAHPCPETLFTPPFWGSSLPNSCCGTFFLCGTESRSGRILFFPYLTMFRFGRMEFNSTKILFREAAFSDWHMLRYFIVCCIVSYFSLIFCIFVIDLFYFIFLQRMLAFDAISAVIRSFMFEQRYTTLLDITTQGHPFLVSFPPFSFFLFSFFFSFFFCLRTRFGYSSVGLDKKKNRIFYSNTTSE